MNDKDKLAIRIFIFRTTRPYGNELVKLVCLLDLGKDEIISRKVWFLRPETMVFTTLTFSFGRELELTNANYNDLVPLVVNSFQVKL